MVLSFDRLTKLITVPITDTKVTIQELLNESRDYQDELPIMDMKNMINCYGKQPLGDGVYVGLTAELLDGWQIKFADRPGPNTIECTVSGGNIVAYDETGTSQFPLEPSNYVFATISASSSATLIDFSPTFIADAVWDENLSTHTTPGTAGKIVSSIKKLVDAIIAFVS